MKEIKMTDLKPEFLNGLEGLKTVQEMKEYCRKEGYDLTDEIAQKLVSQLKENGVLSDEDVADAVGGVAGYMHCPKIVPFAPV